MRSLLQSYCHLNIIKKLSLSWQCFEIYGAINYGSGWRKNVVNQCLEFDGFHGQGNWKKLCLPQWVCVTEMGLLAAGLHATNTTNYWLTAGQFEPRLCWSCKLWMRSDLDVSYGDLQNKTWWLISECYRLGGVLGILLWGVIDFW